MNRNTEVFCNFPFMRHQRSPPTSSRSMPFGGSSSGCGGGGGGGGSGASRRSGSTAGSLSAGSNQATGQSSRTLDNCGVGSSCSGSGGSQTTRRSLPKSMHGYYEGDLSMFAARLRAQAKSATGSLVVEQILENEINQVVHKDIGSKNEKHDETQLTGRKQRDEHQHEQQNQKINQITTLVLGFWHYYKEKLLSISQLKQCDDFIDAIQQNVIFRKALQAFTFLMCMLIHMLRLTFSNVAVCYLRRSWSASRMRNAMRNASRRLLWFIILAKYGDLQLFGLTMLLAPLVFITAIMGLICSFYCMIKHGIQNFMGHVHHREYQAEFLPQYVD